MFSIAFLFFLTVLRHYHFLNHINHLQDKLCQLRDNDNNGESKTMHLHDFRWRVLRKIDMLMFWQILTAFQNDLVLFFIGIKR